MSKIDQKAPIDRCPYCGSDVEIADYIMSFAGEHNIDLDNYDAWQCIEKDYPAGAKQIVQIFETYIKPKIPKE